METANNMQFSDAELESFTRFLDHFLNGQLEAIRIALFAGERAELAAQNAVVRVINVTIDDVTGAIAHLSLPNHIGDCADGVYVLALEKAESFSFGDTLTGDNFL